MNENPYELWTDAKLCELLDGIKDELNETERRRKELIHEHWLAYAVLAKRHLQADENASADTASYPRPQSAENALESGE